MKYLIVPLVICICGIMESHAQFSNIEAAREKIYHGYITGNLKQWEQGLEELSLYEQRQNDLSFKYELALAQYGLIGFYLAEGRKNGLEKRLDQTIGLVKKILQQDPDHAQAHALMGGLYGLKIGLNPAKGIYLGPKSNRHIAIATTQDPTHPAGWVEMGNAKYHTPYLLGGSISEAIKCFSKAVKLFNDNPMIREYNWLYLHSLAWLAQAYEKEANYSQALSIYQKLLSYEPNFNWVKEELLPSLKSRMK